MMFRNSFSFPCCFRCVYIVLCFLYTVTSIFLSVVWVIQCGWSRCMLVALDRFSNSCCPEFISSSRFNKISSLQSFSVLGRFSHAWSHTIPLLTCSFLVTFYPSIHTGTYRSHPRKLTEKRVKSESQTWNIYL